MRNEAMTDDDIPILDWIKAREHPRLVVLRERERIIGLIREWRDGDGFFISDLIEKIMDDSGPIEQPENKPTQEP